MSGQELGFAIPLSPEAGHQLAPAHEKLLLFSDQQRNLKNLRRNRFAPIRSV